MRMNRGKFTQKTGSSRGFTLFEIVMVLALAAILMGGAMGYLIFSSDERHLKGSSGDIEILAKRARTQAMLQQTPYALVISQEGIHMMPLAEAIQPKQSRIGKKDDKTIVAENPRFTPAHAEWIPQDGDRLFVKRWASDHWVPADDRSTHVWRFDPDGICEPLSIRLQSGNSWIEAEYHPLTAAIRYTNLEAN